MVTPSRLIRSQPDGSDTLADNDARFSARVYAVGGVIFAVHNIEVDGRAAIRWYRINAANYSLLESGTITDSNLDLFYPSIAANTNGVVVIACNGCSINTYISSFAYAGLTQNGITTFGPANLLASGSANYHDGNEFSSATGESRWGDYSTISVDPSDRIALLDYSNATPRRRLWLARRPLADPDYRIDHQPAAAAIGHRTVGDKRDSLLAVLCFGLSTSIHNQFDRRRRLVAGRANASHKRHRALLGPANVRPEGILPAATRTVSRR